MYTLLNGERVENLTYCEGEGGWMVSQFFWWNRQKVQESYNTETGELKWINARGEEVISFFGLTKKLNKKASGFFHLLFCFSEISRLYTPLQATFSGLSI